MIISIKVDAKVMSGHKEGNIRLLIQQHSNKQHSKVLQQHQNGYDIMLLDTFSSLLRLLKQVKKLHCLLLSILCPLKTLRSCSLMTFSRILEINEREVWLFGWVELGAGVF